MFRLFDESDSDAWKNKILTESLVNTNAFESDFLNENPLDCKELYSRCVDCQLEKNDINEPWQLIAFSGQIKPIETYFKEHPEDLKKAHKSGRTPLHFAAWGGNIDAVKYFEEKIPFNDQTTMSPLQYASLAGNVDVMELLTIKGADLQQLHPSTGASLLHLAVESKKLNAVKKAFELTADPLIKNNAGKTALDEAIELKLTDIINYIETECRKLQPSCKCTIL